MFQAGQCVVRWNLVGEIVLVDHDLRDAILDDVPVFSQLVTDIERNGDCAQSGDGEHRDDEFDAVADDHGDAVALLYAERLQAAGDSVRPVRPVRRR